MELLMSPIGLVMVVINLSPTASMVEGKIIFECAEASQIPGVFFGTSNLGYRTGPPPRPP